MSRITAPWTVAAAIVVTALAAGCSGGQPEAPAAGRRQLTLQDDVGRTLTLPVPLERTVVFNRYTTEFIRAVAGMDVVVGFDVDMRRTGYYWPGAEHIAVVGQPLSNAAPNYEAIVATKPEVVFFARNSPWEEASRVLAPFGIPVFVMTGWDVLKHEWNVDTLGRLFEQPERANRLNTFYRDYRDLLASRLKDLPARKRVYIEEVGEYKTLLKGSGWHDMVETGGGLNVFGDVDILDQPASRGTVQGFDTDPEEIIERRPDVIIKLFPNQVIRIDPVEARATLKRVTSRPGFSETKAVKSGNVYSLGYYYASAASKIVGALQIAKWLYPDRFEDVDPSEAMRVWLEEFQGVSAPGGYWLSLGPPTP